MEKQPIDDLFRRKLRDIEIKPSNSAWASLQARQGKSRTLPLWTYAAFAASLLLIGSFGWWTLLPQDAVDSPTLIVKATKPTQKGAVPHGEEKLAMADRVQGARRTEPEPDPSVHRGGRDNAGRRDKSSRLVTPENQVLVAQQSTSTTDELQEIRFDLEKKLVEQAPIKSVVSEVQHETSVTSTERILIVSIAQPAPGISKSTTSEIRSTNDTSDHKGALGSLLKKVKRLKDGEVFALSTDESGKTSRRGLSKVYEEVKESIRNNSTD